jgi:hypothetical protein
MKKSDELKAQIDELEQLGQVIWVCKNIDLARAQAMAIV